MLWVSGVVLGLSPDPKKQTLIPHLSDLALIWLLNINLQNSGSYTKNQSSSCHCLLQLTVCQHSRSKCHIQDYLKI